MDSTTSNGPTDFKNLKDQQYKEQEVLQTSNAALINKIDKNRFNFLNYNEDTDTIYNGNSGNVINEPGTTVFDWLLIFLLIYFILYFIVSFFFSLETLSFLFSAIDYLVLIIIILVLLSGLVFNTGNFGKYTWNGIKPFLTDFSYLMYIIIIIGGFEFFLYMGKNTFDVYKPIVLSLIQGFLYVILVIIIIIDVFQLAFNVPLITILENDINKPSKIDYKKTTITANAKEEPRCINVKSFKDPNAIRSFYDLQMTNFQMVKKYYDDMVVNDGANNDGANNDGATSSCNFKPNLQNSGPYGYPNNTGFSTNIPKSQLDANINIVLQYWADNSGNILQK